MAKSNEAINNIVDEAIENTVNEDIEKTEQAPRPFVVWTVDGQDFRLKLTTAWIQKLEQQFKKPLMQAVTDDGIPATSVIVPILQAALQKYNHGIKSNTVNDMLVRYIEGGKNIYDLLNEAIYPLMFDAGFFTKTMLDTMTAELQTMDQLI